MDLPCRRISVSVILQINDNLRLQEGTEDVCCRKYTYYIYKHFVTRPFSGVLQTVRTRYGKVKISERCSYESKRREKWLALYFVPLMVCLAGVCQLAAGSNLTSLKANIYSYVFLLCLTSYEKPFLPFAYQSIDLCFCSNRYLYYLKERIKGREVCLNFRIPYIATFLGH